MKTYAVLLTLVIALTLCLPALAQGSTPPPPEPVILTDEQGEYPLGLHLEILEDPTGKLTIDQVSSPEFDAQFIPSQTAVPNYGFTDSIFWVRLRLDNQTRHTYRWLLEQGFANTHFVDLYTPLPGGEGFSVKQTGGLRPAATRDIHHPRIVFNLTIPPQSQQTYYLRFQNGASMTLPLTLWTQAAFLNRSLVEQVWMGIFYGILIGLLIYNLFLLISLREANYLLFVFLLTALILEEITYDGYLYASQLSNLNLPMQFAQGLFFALLIASMVVFSHSFLELKLRYPLFNRLNLVLLAGWVALIVLIPFIRYGSLAGPMVLWAMLSLVVIVIAGGVSWMRGFQPARFFMFAWLGLLASTIWVLLIRLGLLPSTVLSENIYRLTYVWMVVCWSIALADRINLLRSEKEAAHLEVQASEARYRQLVETMNDGLGVRDEQGRFTYVNNRLAEMLGYQPEDLIGHMAAEFVDEDNSQRMRDQWERRKTGLDAPYEMTWQKKGGGEVFTLVSPVPLFEDRMHYAGSFAVVTDITERVQASRTLEQQVEERTRELSALLGISRDISASEDLTVVLKNVLERLKTVVDYHVLIILSEKDGKWKSLVQDCPASSETPEAIEFSTPEVQAITKDFVHGGPVLISETDLQKESLNGFGILAARLSSGWIPNVHCWLGVPLLEKGNVFGALVLGREDECVSEDQMKVIVASANQAAIAIENHRLYEQIRESVMYEERNRLARDLHDSVTQVLFSATLLAEVLPQIWRRDPELGLQKLGKLWQLMHGALAEMRTMLLELRPSAVINTPLSDLLAQLAAAVTSRSGLPFQLNLEQIPPLPENVHITFYRIAQETLNNIVKHARANRVIMTLRATPLDADTTGGARHEVRLVIQDDGVGFLSNRTETEHMGIGIMRERAATIQASFSLNSQPGQGTQVTLVWCGETGSQS